VCLASQTASPACRHARSELLAVRLRVENLSETRKVEDRGWGRGSSFPDIQIAILKDNFGNRYTSIPFSSATRVEGQVSSASLYPGKSVGSVVVFEEPVARAEYLRLELPASAFGGTVKLRFQIPKSMIERR
jgi:hypothetical protein